MSSIIPNVVGTVPAEGSIVYIHCGKAFAVIIIVLLTIFARISRRKMRNMQLVQIGFVVNLKQQRKSK